MSLFLQSRWFVVILYFIFGSLWILVSDTTEHLYSGDLGPWYQTAKGLLYVLLTSVLLFVIISHQQKRVRKALADSRNSDRTKSDYLIISSHELRTPLNVMNGLISLLEKNPTDAEREKYHSFLRIAHDNLHQTVNSVLELADAKSGTKKTQTDEVFNPSTLLQQCCETYQTAFPERSITYNDKASDCMVTGDVKRFEQSVMQLLSNHIKFTDSTCRVSIDTIVNDSDFKVHFKDNGPGLPSDKIASVFSGFQQYGDILRRSHRGVGVGLALVHSFITEMGGRIRAEDTHGSGTHIIITLPVSDLNGSQQHTEPQTAVQTKLNILLVDDDPLTLMVERKMLSAHGHSIETAENGEEAVRAVQSNHNAYDVVFMDVIMPVLDGLEAVRRIRRFEKQNNLNHLRIVIVSANAFENDIEAGYKAGADAYLVKPASAAQMLEKALNS